MDAMVTARMQSTKKESGNRVLESLGTTASAAINQLYDYLLIHNALPWENESDAMASVSSDELSQALAWVDSLQINLSPEFAGMSLAEAHSCRLAHQLSVSSKA